MTARASAAVLVLVGLTASCGGGHRKVAFTLGTAARNVPYCNAQTLDLFVPQAGRRPLPSRSTSTAAA